MDESDEIARFKWTKATFGFVLAAFEILALLIWFFWFSDPSDIPPFPRRPYPILGHIPYLWENYRKTLQEWRRTTGDIFSVYLGRQLYIVINGYAAVKEALMLNANVLSSRPKNCLIDDSHRGIIWAKESQWKEQRNVSIFLMKNFGMGKSSISHKIAVEVSKFICYLTQRKGSPVDIEEILSTSVSNIICNILIGRRFDNDDPFFKAFNYSLREKLLTSADNLSVAKFLPWLRYLPGNIFGCQNLNNCIQEIESDFFDHFIREVEEAQKYQHSFISAYNDEREIRNKSGRKNTLNRANLRRVLLELFFAGSDTITATLLWFMNFMAHHREIQAVAFTEIVRVVGTSRTPELSDKPKLPFVNAVIMETLRLSAVGPLSFPRLCEKEISIKGYTIPAGAHVIIGMDSLHLDEATWGDSLNFRPRRFLDYAGNLVKPDVFVPFLIGKRACLGEALANTELFLFVSALIQKFEIRPTNPDCLPSLKGTPGIIRKPEISEFRFWERPKF